jgi:hypothetical protein
VENVTSVIYFPKSSSSIEAMHGDIKDGYRFLLFIIRGNLVHCDLLALPVYIGPSDGESVFPNDQIISQDGIRILDYEPLSAQLLDIGGALCDVD